MATGLPLVEADDRPVTVDRRARLLLGAAGLAYTALFLRWSFRNFEGHGAFAFDLGIFDQGVWLLSRLELYVVQLVAPLGFAPWWAPGLALVAAGPLALNLISDFEYQYDVRYHYSTLILPILVVATIYGVASGPALKHGIAVRGVLAVSALCAYLWSPLPFGDSRPSIANPAARRSPASTGCSTSSCRRRWRGSTARCWPPSATTSRRVRRRRRAAVRAAAGAGLSAVGPTC